jgi:hypothetical protein
MNLKMQTMPISFTRSQLRIYRIGTFSDSTQATCLCGQFSVPASDFSATAARVSRFLFLCLSAESLFTLKLIPLSVTRSRCYDHNFLRFSTIFGEKIGVFLTIFCDFRQFSAKKLAFFSKTDVMITIFAKTSSSLSKNANFFAKFFGENI